MLIYPPNMLDKTEDRPVITFRTSTSDAGLDDWIALPLPSSIQFGDSISYGQADIGMTGGMIVNAGRSQSVEAAVASVPKALEAINNNSSLKSAVGLLGSAVGGEYGTAISIASGTTLNKNLVTEFTGVGIRSFTFSFKLVSTSRLETETIRKMIHMFRSGAYPEGDLLQLRYPTNWYINFKQNGKDIEWIPKIFETFLTSVNTNYNASGSNMFHPDGSPVDTELQLSFIETRALLKSDITRLNDHPYRKGDFALSVNGVQSEEIGEINQTDIDARMSERFSDQSAIS